MSGRLYVGIDLGTFQSTIASAQVLHSVETWLGDQRPVARNFLNDVLFGADALKNKLACNLYRNGRGVAQDDEANLAAAKAVSALSNRRSRRFDEVFGVIALRVTFHLPKEQSRSNSTWPSQCNHGRY